MAGRPRGRDNPAMRVDGKSEIWLDGAFVPFEDAKVHVLTHALHYGGSVFEGMRAYPTSAGPAVLGLEPHVRRLFDSCKTIELALPYEPEQIAEAICETVERNGHDSCYIRPLAWRGMRELGIDPSECPTQVMVATWPYGRHWGEEAAEAGIDVCVSSWRRMAPDTHPAMVKAGGNYLNSQLMILEAKRHGYHDAIALDSEGYACEASGMNLFAALGGRLLTPPLAASILGGVTRAYAIELARDLGIEVVEQRVSREMLYFADELFLTGTAAEITPVRSVDAKPVGAGARGPLTERLQQAFFGIVSGGAPDRRGWLTPVRDRARRA